MRLFISFFLLSLLFSLSLTAQDYGLERLPYQVNSNEFDEINPIVSIDGKTLFYTKVGSSDANRTIWFNGRDVSDSLSLEEYYIYLSEIYTDIAGQTIFDPMSSDFNQDIWFATTEKEDLYPFMNTQHPPAPLNNGLPNSVCSLTPDPNTFVVVNQFSRDGGMNKGFSLVKRRKDGTFTDPKAMNIEGYEVLNGTAVSLTMSQDGTVMILSLPAADSYGDNDLYISFKITENSWSKPQNLGNKINTAYREVTPYLSANGKELYFASNRRESSGGLDIFFARRTGEDWEQWSDIQRFVYPINSDGDDSQPYFNNTTGYLYFSSKRANTSDIYRVKIAPETPQEVKIHGMVINTFGDRPVDATVEYGLPNSKVYQKKLETIENEFNLKVKTGQSIEFVPKKKNFICHAQRVDLDPNQYYANPIEVRLYIDPVVRGGQISLQPIFFEQSKANILPKSEPDLEELVKILNEYPQITLIRIEGHTDNQGEEKSLLQLSEERATAVKKFLTKKGISDKRIEVIGYGGKRPLGPNNNDTERQRNRRVEVKIIKIK